MKPRLWEKLLPAAIIGAGAGTVVYVLGLPVTRAAGLAVTAVVIALVFLATAGLTGAPRRPTPPATIPRRAAAPRWEIERFHQLYSSPLYLAEPTRERLLEMVDARLRSRGSSFAQARADGSIGPGPWELLERASERLPSRAQLTELSDAIRRVLPAAPTPDPARATPARDSQGARRS